jgi:hypothetical protein
LCCFDNQQTVRKQVEGILAKTGAEAADGLRRAVLRNIAAVARQ